MRKIILLLLISNVLFAQKIVPDLQSVKNPKNGKLYFSEKENKLAIFANKQFYGLFQAPSDTIAPPTPPPVQKETVAGYWSDKDKILVAYSLSGGLWLMQRDPSGTYYVSRGKNLLSDPSSYSNGKITVSQLSGENTDLGGLYKPSSFPEDEFLKETGRVKNSSGEYVKSGGGGGGTKIKQPVGVIRWDGYFTSITPDNPIDVTKETRYALSDPRTKDQGPFYSTFTEDQNLKKQKWNNDSKEWTYTDVVANIKFDGDRPGIMEKEVDLAIGAGIDYFLFNYYATNAAPMAIARQQFEALPNKKGLRAAYIMENIGGDMASEVKLIASAMRKDWYQKIDGKPLLVLPPSSGDHYDRVYEIYLAIKGAYGGELYTVLQVMGYPVEIAGEVRKRGYNSHTRYSTWGGWNEGDHSHRYIMNQEWQWYQDSKKESVDFSPNITVSFYQVGAQKSWDGLPDYAYSEKATDAEFEEQIKRTAEYVKDNSQVKTVILYSWNEYTEGGRTVSPQLRRDGTVDDRILNILSKYLE